MRPRSIPICWLAVAVALILSVFAQLGQAQTYTVLYNFAGGDDGANPWGQLVHDATKLYGTTGFGGIGGGGGFGNVFMVNASGEQTILHLFNGLDGEIPSAGMVRDPQGNLYGTTAYGGKGNCLLNGGCGVLFKLDPSGQYTVLHYFAGRPDDGATAHGGIVRDREGNLYGATLQGGTIDCGTIFKLDANGKETVLHSFDGGDGCGPDGDLVLGPGGNLYGTASSGGGTITASCSGSSFNPASTAFCTTSTSVSTASTEQFPPDI